MLRVAVRFVLFDATAPMVATTDSVDWVSVACCVDFDSPFVFLVVTRVVFLPTLFLLDAVRLAVPTRLVLLVGLGVAGARSSLSDIRTAGSSGVLMRSP